MNTKTFTIGVIALIGFVLCYININPLTEEKGATAQASIVSSALASSNSPIKSAVALDEINWISWEEAVEANKKNPKKIIVDVYTDWCGWCKRMDATTFKDPGVSAYVEANFYAVKLDAEQREDIVYDGNTFVYKSNGKRGVHQLAASLLDNRLSYPSIVYLNGNMERIMISPGYKDADSMLKELKYANGEKS